MIRITKNSIENFARGDMLSKAYEKVLSNPELLPLFMARYGNRLKKFSPKNLSDDLAWSTSDFDKLDGANLIKKAEANKKIKDLIEKSKNKPRQIKSSIELNPIAKKMGLLKDSKLDIDKLLDSSNSINLGIDKKTGFFKDLKPKENKIVPDKDDLNTILNLNVKAKSSKGVKFNPIIDNIVGKKINFKKPKEKFESVNISSDGVTLSPGGLFIKMKKINPNNINGEINFQDDISKDILTKGSIDIPKLFDEKRIKEIEKALSNKEVSDKVVSQIKSNYVKGSSPLMKHLIRNNKITHQPLFEQAQLVGSPWEIYPVETSVAALGGAGAVGLGAYNITKEK